LDFLDEAEKFEKIYEWLKATESYREALKLLSEDDSSRRGRLLERSGYALYRAAMQAESSEEFRRRICGAITDYDGAKRFYERLSDVEKKARVLRCEAMIALMNYWLAEKAPEKKRLLEECWKLAKGALEAFEGAGASVDYGKAYNMLQISPVFEFTLESDFHARVRIMKETVECGEKAIRFLSASGDVSELARAYAKTVVCLAVFGYYCQDMRDREPIYQKGLDYWRRAKELSEETAIVESLYPVFGGQPFFGLEGSDEALSNCKKGLEYAKKTGDRFFVGCALDWLVYHTVWKTMGTEDKDEMTQLVKTAQQYIQDARDHFSKISFVSPRADVGWIEASPADTDYWLASMETDVRRKRALLEKAAETAPEMLKKAENSGYPEVIMYAHMIFGSILSSLARIETNREEKKRLLEQALQHRKECVTRVEQLTPLLYWNRGIHQRDLAMTKSGLADVAEDNETKKNLLLEAALATDGAIKLQAEELAFFESKRSGSTSLFADIGSAQSEYGDLLNRLYGLTRNREHLEKAIKVFREATESFQKLNLKSRIAECHWKIAQAYDAMGEHSSAAQHFALASNEYRNASEKIPQLKGFYQDHACYMEAWSEIEKARHHHKRQEYGLAEEHFQNAANMHKSLKQWSCLAPNYSAWAQVERAEELSRKDQSEEALQGFEKATKLFEETKKSIQNGLAEIEDSSEKQMAAQIANATDLRREYCKARIAIEEAKILDKKGDHQASSEKYDSAAESLQKITQMVQSEQDKKEFSLISTISQAWARMTRAEAEGSPDLYLEASQLFEKAKELSPDERAKMLALGHSRFCRALEAGTRFADTGNAELYRVAIQHLESAAKHYVRAGFQNASEYAKATELLLDAYLHMDNAKAESDPEKKARLYVMAEKVLQTSAGSFMKAEHPEKREQVLRLLERVKEERELALSLSEALHAPSIVSATSAFTMPTPNQENAVGLEKFERANIQANIITRQKELKVGEDLDLEIELVNAGKSPAQLIKITGVIPEGFALAEKPETYRIEDSFINMKGKRLDPLKTEEVKLTIKPKVQGEFSLRPTVLYLDENGQYKSHQPELTTLRVTELGIKGWLKGER
jgi:tetratricopeptide (TPR) repeat protein